LREMQGKKKLGIKKRTSDKLKISKVRGGGVNASLRREGRLNHAGGWEGEKKGRG